MSHSHEISDTEFKAMTVGPAIAWPTVLLFVAVMLAIASVNYLAVIGQLPLWLGMVLNGISTYFLFSVVHDSAHGSISKHSRLNDAFGHIGMMFFGPLAPFNLARWIHMQHHRLTNVEGRDPDYFGHIMDKWTPLRWMFFDYYYTKFFLQQAGNIRKKFALRLIMQISLVLFILAASAYAGYGWEVLFLWVLPTRISSVLFIAMFVYLPHVPFTHSSLEDEYKASSLRPGMEWLLSPLMVFQNYHLVHHLYPRAPFYRMEKIWNARLEMHMAQKPFLTGPFAHQYENKVSAELKGVRA